MFEVDFNLKSKVHLPFHFMTHRDYEDYEQPSWEKRILLYCMDLNELNQNS